MKILVGHNYYQQPGGEDGVFRAEVEMLRNHGHDVVVYERHNAEVEESLWAKIRQPFNLCFSRRSYNDVRSLIRAFRPDVAHFHNTFFRMSPSVYSACSDEGVPVIQSLHNFRMACLNALFLRNDKVCEACLSGNFLPGVWHRCYRHSFLLSVVMANFLFFQRKLWFSKVDRFIVFTQFARAQFIRIGLPEEKLVVKPHYVLRNSANAMAKDGGYVLYAGRLSAEKGVDFLLRVWLELREFPLYIAGSGPLADQIKMIVERDKLTCVRLLGFLGPASYQEILSNARVLVVPSLCYENFPRVMVEAYACGIPVITGRQGGLPEIVRDNVTGVLFDQGDVQSLRTKVRDLMAGNKAEVLGRNARAVYEREYTEQRNHDMLMKIYQEGVSK